MDNLTIEQGNRIIAEFHGWKHIATPKRKGKGIWNFPEWNRTQWAETGFQYHSSWEWLMPVVQKIRNFKDPFRVSDESYIFGGMSVHISSAYPSGWKCHILGKLTRFTKLETGMHDYKDLPEYSKSISSEKDEDFINPIWQSCVQFIQFYNTQNSNSFCERWLRRKEIFVIELLK